MKYIRFRNDRIVFENPGNTGRCGRQKSFSLLITSVKIVGIRFMYLFDNDEYFIVIVDSAEKTYFLNSIFFDEMSFEEFKEVFKLKLDISSFDDSYYNRGKSIILYPNHYYGQQLFKDKNILVKPLVLLCNELFNFKNPAWGRLTNESKAIITAHSS